MNGLPHRIRRQRWLVRASTQAQAFEVRARLRAELEGPVLAAIERAFDEAVPGDQLVHLPRLELTIRAPALEDTAAFAAALEDSVREQLRVQLRRANPPVTLPSGASPDLAMPPSAAAEMPSLPARGSTALDDLRRHYLQTGTLPWVLVGLEQQAVREALALDGHAAIRELEHHRRQSASAPLSLEFRAFLHRVLHCLPLSEWTRLASHGSSGPWEEAVTRAIATLASERGPSLTPHIRLQLASLLLAAREVSPERIPAAQVWSLLLGVMGRSDALSLDLLDEWLPSSVAAVFRHWLQRATDDGAPSPEAAPPPEPAATADRLARPVPAVADELPVLHAGLVILHPYLVRFFESTGVKTPSERRLPESKLPRAAALLHWLATGEDGLAEWQLGFIKPLLGLRLDAPLSVGEGLLAPEDREEAEALLAAVRDHWKALKNTGARGLQTSFLQRRGLLGEREHGLTLRMEPAAWDVLLGALPWGIGTMKLPWMDRPIFTEWPTH